MNEDDEFTDEELESYVAEFDNRETLSFDEQQRLYQLDLKDIDKRAKHLESLTSEERQALFTKPYP
jgi:hypothetical protein